MKGAKTMKNSEMKSTLTPLRGNSRLAGQQATEPSRKQSLLRRLFAIPLGAALRIHQYRNLHSAMVYEALRQIDRCDPS
jgi:hypothetical protein